MKREKYAIAAIVILACAGMAYVDGVLRPGYVIKSAVKLPSAYSRFSGGSLRSLFRFKPGGARLPLILGIGVYLAVLGAYFALRRIFDFSQVTSGLAEGAGVNGGNFVWVAAYISFVNSLLEEFFFRGFAFLKLKEVSSRKFAYWFSSAAFAAYHLPMTAGWFHFGVTALALLGLLAGGMIFNMCNEKQGNIYTSWFVHMFANFAINTVGFILFKLI